MTTLSHKDDKKRKILRETYLNKLLQLIFFFNLVTVLTKGITGQPAQRIPIFLSTSQLIN